MKLTAEIVNQIFMNCLFKEGEPTDNFIKAEAIQLRCGFHPGRLEENKSKIAELCDELPEDFQRQRGGGWTFLNMCNDKNGNQWADLHSTMDQLLALGLATGKISYNLEDRSMWSVFPGGMPYITVN